MGGIGVHLDDDLIAALERPAKTRDIGLTQALFPGPMEHGNCRILFRQFLGEVAGSVGGSVINDEDIRIWDGVAQARNCLAQHFAFVIGGDDYERFHRTSTSVTTSDCLDRKSTRLNSSHVAISYAVFCLK